MDFGIIYQLKIKKFWWLDTIFYFVVAFLLATVICFLIFSLKISLQEKKLNDLENKISNTGTSQQKEMEEKVFKYQKKIDDFAAFLAEHKIPTNILKFMEKTTFPNVWFNNFIMNAQASQIQLIGEAENSTALSRQVLIFEESDFVRNVTELSSEPTESGRIKFNVNLILNQDLFFSTTFEPGGILETVTPSTSSFLNRLIF